MSSITDVPPLKQRPAWAELIAHQFSPDGNRLASAAGCGSGLRGAARRPGGGAADGAGLVEGVGVALDDVDLPGLVARTGDPDLVLDGVAACGAFSDIWVEPGSRQPVGRRPNLVSRSPPPRLRPASGHRSTDAGGRM